MRFRFWILVVIALIIVGVVGLSHLLSDLQTPPSARPGQISSRRSKAPSFSSSQINVQPASVPSVSGVTLTARDNEKIGKILTVFGSPISFFGRVVDNTGSAIAGASIYYSAADRYFGDSSKYQGVSDAAGRFSISGIKGAGLYVEVSKEGYDRIPNDSYGSFGYGMPSGRQPPSKDEPAVFILRKKGPTEPLVVVSKLANDNYAHIKIEMMAGGDYNFFVLESYVNPSGSRNLEFDRKKAIQAH
jgi:hypothetical protein